MLSIQSKPYTYPVRPGTYVYIGKLYNLTMWMGVGVWQVANTFDYLILIRLFSKKKIFFKKIILQC